ncbi:site-specific DNA-methyltransferase [Deefgea piscis]|uniref:site-specific DNA-methyltransferase n=1 Tax=Deefgea piscis TaxID=2739061 RepID=UPI001C7F20F0|nr:site-specific DNA-methyltransferase [Deefgea piscis]QZA80840.1 site-specific DNA-methyltransferase [Deefgea piscis]
MTRLTLEYRPLSDLIPYANNARTHSEAQIEQIARSIDQFGFTNPVLVDGCNGIIAGHGRVLAANKRGFNEAPVIELSHMSEAQKRAYILADNQLAMNSGWDKSLLEIELGALRDFEFDLSLIGFDEEDLARFLPELLNEGLCDEDDAPELPEEPCSKPGDLWILGPHRVLCGDSTNLDHVAQLMDGYLADLIVTDPPYNVAYEGKTKDKLTIENDAMNDGKFYRFLLDAYAGMFAFAKDGAGLYVFHADSEGMNFRKAMLDAGFKLAQCCIWVKQSLVLGRQDYQWQHEPVLYGWKPTGPHRWYTDRSQTTVWRFDRPARNDVHPTMKPVELICYPISNSSRGGDIVLDLFGGSGSTLIACHKLGRHARIMELDPRYVDVIIQRWQTFSGLIAIHAESGAAFGQ